MGRPSKRQIAEAIIHSARSGESVADCDARLASLSRLSDAELAAMGIGPPPDSGNAPPTEPANDAPSDGPTPETGNGPPPETASVLPAPGQEPLAFDPAATRARHDGWTAARQRAFIAALAETGCVSEACAEVGITPRSAYRLREHAAAASFRAAWGHAESMATARLTALAFERAVHGSVESIYRDGVLVEERRKPSDKLLMWLLSHRDPVGFGWLERPPSVAPDASFYPLQSARSELPQLLEDMADIDPAACRAEPVAGRDIDHDSPSPRA